MSSRCLNGICDTNDFDFFNPKFLNQLVSRGINKFKRKIVCLKFLLMYSDMFCLR